MKRALKNRLYAAMLVLQGEKVLVVGGGAVATRKISALEGTGAKVVCVAPLLSAAAKRALSLVGGVGYERCYRPRDLAAARLVFCASDDANLNAQIAAVARKKNIWANVATSWELSTFWVPALWRQGKMQVAVSSGGRGPRAAQRWRDQIRDQFSKNSLEKS